MDTRTSEPLTIAHISDLHVGDDEETIWAKLEESFVRYHPKLLLITGDLVETPNHDTFALALLKLQKLCTGAKIHNEEVYFAPGNHDCRIKGLLWRHRLEIPIAARTFPKWLQPSGTGFFDKEKRIAFFIFDSNFSTDLFNAGGKIGRDALQIFNKHCDRFEAQPEYQASLKVVLLHHHPLPIPYSQQFERFLVLDDAGEFLRHMCQRGIHLILHGHKHHRASSVVSLQDPYGEKRAINVVACSSTTKRISEAERRGYNLITIYENNRVEVLSLDYTPGAGFDPPATSPVSFVLPSPETFIQRSHESQVKAAGYRIGTFLRHITVDDEGDVLERIHIAGLQATNRDSSVTIHPFRIFAGAGQVKRPVFAWYKTPIKYRIDEAKGPPPQTCTLTIEPDDKWRQQITAYEFELSAWSLNSVALDQTEFNSKYERLTNIQEEYWEHEFEDLVALRPIDTFLMVIQFPPGYTLPAPPTLKIFKREPEERSPWTYHRSETWLEEHYKNALIYSPGLSHIILSLATPSTGYVYRVYWPVPSGTPHSSLRARYATKLQDGVLQMRGNNTINQLMSEIAQKIQGALQASEEIDVTLMGRYQEESSSIAKLKAVASNLPPGSPIWGHTLFVGDGISGRAFKSGKIWSFVSLKEDFQVKPTGYVPIAKGFSHAVLHAFPLLYQDHNGPAYGVVMVGSRQDPSVLSFPERDHSNRIKELAKIVYETAVIPLHNMCKVPLVPEE
jgi:hypothetical protein